MSSQLEPEITVLTDALLLEKDVAELKEIIIEMNSLVFHQKNTIDQINQCVIESNRTVEKSNQMVQSIMTSAMYSRVVKGSLVFGTAVTLLSPVGISLKITTAIIGWGLVQLF